MNMAFSNAPWTAMVSMFGEEYGATYLGHFLDVAEFGGRWLWSASHPATCALEPGVSLRRSKPKRGQADSAETLVAAQRAAMQAVDGFPCAVRSRRP